MPAHVKRSPKLPTSSRIEPLEPRRLFAADFWTGLGGNSNFSTPANWSNNAAPIAGDDLVFQNVSPNPSASLTPHNDLAAGTLFNSIQFAGPGYTLDGNAIQLANGISFTAANITTHVSLPITLSADQTFAPTQSPVTAFFTNSIDVGSHALTIEGSFGSLFAPGNTHLQGNITGTGSIIIRGSVSFEGVSSFSGTVTQNIGSPFVSGSLASATVNLSGNSADGLTGTGTVGAVTVNGGFIHPGDPSTDTRGMLHTGDLSMTNAYLFVIVGSSSNANTADSVAVTGTVNLSNVLLDNLAYDSSANITPGDVFTLISNDGTDPIVGTIKGLTSNSSIPLTEGATVSAFASGAGLHKLFRISYVGGDGNDVTLTALPPNAGMLALPLGDSPVNPPTPATVFLGQSQITIDRTGGDVGTVTVQVDTTDGTAIAGVDYGAIHQTVTFPDGIDQEMVQLDLTEVRAPQPDKTFTVTLSNPAGGATLGSPSSAVLTIVDTLPPPTLSIADVSLPEGNAGTTTANFVITLSAAATQNVTVDYTTQDPAISIDTPNPAFATAGIDYVPTSGSLTFAPGETTKTISVPIIGDTAIEPDEVFALALSNPTGAAFARATATGTIINDDQPASAPSFDTTPGAAVVIPVFPGDSTLDPSSAVLGTTITPKGTLALGTGQQLGDIIYTPNPNTVGEDSFDYTVENQFGIVAASSADVMITGTISTSDPLAPNKTALNIGGTSANDTITLLPGKKNTLTVMLNGVSQGSFAQPAGHIFVDGGDGNDTIDLSKFKGKASAVIDGGAGDDIITGTANNDILRGGAGNDYLNAKNGNNILIGGDGTDVLQGGSGKDLLIGGAGQDFLFGGSGDDLLIAGSTALDPATIRSSGAINSTITDQGLSGILNIWAGKGSYTKRLGQITALQSAGNFPISDDDAPDTLKGNAGTDAFFAHFTGTTPLDVITDKAKSESAIEI